MKKRLYFVLCVVVALSVCFAFAGCKGKKDADDTSGDSNVEIKGDTDVTINVDDIFGSDYGSEGSSDPSGENSESSNGSSNESDDDDDNGSSGSGEDKPDNNDKPSGNGSGNSSIDYEDPNVWTDPVGGQ